MAFVITQACIDTRDQACVSVCPVDCIHFEEGSDRMLYINPAECIDCGACQPACPVNAIYPESGVPDDLKQFIEINALWYSNPAGARSRVGGGAGAPAAAPAEGAPVAAAAAAPAAPAAKAAPAAAPVRVQQVPAEGHAAPVSTPHRLPSPMGVAALVVMALTFTLMFTVPGPGLLTFGSTKVGATIVLLLPVTLLSGLVFAVSQVRALSTFAASHPRQTAGWRRRWVEFRRNEESRRYHLVQIVKQVAAERFAYPDQRNPDLRTFVNLPEPTLAIEPRGTGEKLFPDIVAVSVPGNVPVAIAQVESRETVTREQATQVWARLENQQTTFYLYVPAGSLRKAQDYAKAAGIRRVQFRTWRWSPNGMIVREA